MTGKRKPRRKFGRRVLALLLALLCLTMLDPYAPPIAATAGEEGVKADIGRSEGAAGEKDGAGVPEETEAAEETEAVKENEREGEETEAIKENEGGGEKTETEAETGDQIFPEESAPPKDAEEETEQEEETTGEESREETSGGETESEWTAGENLTEDVETDPVLENYIEENLDRRYISSCDKKEIVNAILVKQTFFDGAAVKKSDTIDGIMTAIEEVGDEESLMKYIAQLQVFVAVYDLSDDSDYDVAFVDTLHGNSSTYVQDAVFALATNAGQVLDDCIYDYETGLAYIKKTDIQTEDGRQILLASQMQLMQVICMDDTETKISASVTGEDGVKVCSSSSQIFKPETEVKTQPGLEKEALTVSLNGIPAPESEYTYDAETGIVTIAQSSGVVGNISVTVEEEDLSLPARAARALTRVRDTAARAARDSLDAVTGAVEAYAVTGGWEGMEQFTDGISLPSWVTVNTVLEGKVDLCYKSSGHYSDWVGSYGYEGGSDEWQATLTDLILNGGSVNPEYLVSQQGNLYLNFKINMKNNTLHYRVGSDYAGNTEPESSDTIDTLTRMGTLTMVCAHLKNALTENSSDVSSSTYKQKDALMRFLYINDDDNYAVVGIVTAKICTQSGTATYRIGIDEREASMELKKSTASDYSSLVKGNDCYSLDGAQYKVYDNYADAKNREASEGLLYTFNTDEDGDTKIVSKDRNKYDLLYGQEVYLVETIAPSGYQLDTEGGHLTVEGEKMGSSESDAYYDYGNGVYKVTLKDETLIQAEDIPLFADLTLWKGDQETKSFLAEKVTHKLNKGIFRLRFYRGSLTSGEMEETSATKKWYLQTKTYANDEHANYQASLDTVITNDEDYTSSAVYTDPKTGDPILPLGSLELNEIKAPQYYSKDCIWIDLGDDTRGTLFMRLQEVDQGTKGKSTELVLADETETQVGTIKESGIILKVYDAPAEVHLSLKKETANSYDSYAQMVSGNPNYSLEGSLYGVYATKEEAGDDTYRTAAPLWLLICDKKGNSSLMTEEEAKGTAYRAQFYDTNGDGQLTKEDGLEENTTYYIRELHAGPGYRLRSRIYTAKTGEGEEDDEDCEIVADDPPLYVTLRLLKENLTGNTSIDMSNLVFDVEYRKNTSTTREWYIRTIQSGSEYLASLDAEHLVIGNDFYMVNGEAALPLGTVRITEIDPNDDDFAEVFEEIDPNPYFNVEDMVWKAGNYTHENNAVKLSLVEVENENGDKRVQVLGGDSGTDTGLGNRSADDGSDLIGVGAGSPISATAYDKVPGIGIEIVKKDAESGQNTPQGAASFEGAVYEIQYAQDGDTVRAGDVVATLVLTYDSDKESWTAQTAEDALTEGEYKIVETVPPTGYQAAGDRTVTVTMVGDGKMKVTIDGTDTRTVEYGTIVDVSSEETVKHIGLIVPKVDREREDNVPQGDASLSGTVYTITNVSENSVWVDLGGGRKEYRKGDEITAITSGEDGVAEIAAILPYGYYEVKETTAPTGYLNSGYDAILPPSAWLSGAEDGAIYEASKSEDTLNRDQVKRGGLAVQKVDQELYDWLKVYFPDIDWDALDSAELHSALAERASAGSQGDAVLGEGIASDLKDYLTRDLSDAVFKIVNRSSHAVLVDCDQDGVLEENEWFEPNQVVYTMYTDSDGYAQTPTDLLPYGTYEVLETASPGGYLGEDEKGTYERASEGTYAIHTVTIREDHHLYTKDDTDHYLGTYIEDPVIRGGVAVQKRDAEQKDGDVSGLGDSLAEGGAVLSGAIFNIYNLSGHNVLVDRNQNGIYDEDERFLPGQLVYTLVTDEEGIAATGKETLPYGTYMVVEVSSPTGYLSPQREYLTDEEAEALGLVFSRDQDLYYVNGTCYFYETKEKEFYRLIPWTVTGEGRSYCEDGMTYDGGSRIEDLYDSETGLYYDEKTGTRYFWDRDRELFYYLYESTNHAMDYSYGVYERKFEIRNEEEIVDLTGPDASLYDLVGRGDFKLRKIDSETQKTMAGVEFRITSLTTGESHVIVTDSDGCYSSESNYRKHSDPDGLWFGLDAEGNSVPVDDALGALPYDAYRIEEIEGEVNRGRNMISFDFFINDTNSDNTFVHSGYVNDLGDLENSEPVLTSSAAGKDSGSHRIEAGAETEIEDTVFYDHLTPGLYRVDTVLVDAETGRILTEAGGREVTASREVKLQESEGTIHTELSFDSSGWEGLQAVVYEYFYRIAEDGTESLSYAHTDRTDEEQTVTFYGIGTTAADPEGEKKILASEEITIVDTVEYTNLEANHTYTVTGTLMRKSTGEVYLDDSGSPVTGSTTFTTDETGSGSVEVIFTFSGRNLEGDAVVVFEDLYRGSVRYAVHEDPEDEGQTVSFPKIRTHAEDRTADLQTGSSAKAEEESVTIVDEVTYEGLDAGKTYTMTGILVDRDTGETLTDENGQPITSSVSFVASESGSGTVEVIFTLPSSCVKGRSVVAFEYAADQNREVAVHADLEDEDQTVTYPEIKTTLTNDWTGEHQATIFENHEISLTDTVEFEGLTVGNEYTVRGVLMDRETGEALRDSAGNEVEAESTFLAETESGTVEITFVFFAAGLHGTQTVAFESLYEVQTGLRAAAHEDIEDEGQTVELLSPTLWTYAAETLSGKKSLEAETEVSVTDSLELTGLIVGHTYYVYGKAVDPSTGEIVTDGDGKAIEMTVEFTADAPEMVLDIMEFHFNAASLAGESIVFEEYLYADENRTILITEEEDLGSAEQTIFFKGPVNLQTTLLDAESGTHTAQADGSITLVDTVLYEGVTVGETYTVTGTLMNQATGQAVTDETGQPVTAESTFTAGAENGTVEVTFVFDAESLAGESVVAYEQMYGSDGLAAAHEDLGDEAQTVELAAQEEQEKPRETNPDDSEIQVPEISEIPAPEIGTTLTDSATGSQTTEAGEETTLTDTVQFSGLTAGETYLLVGTLMDGDSGEVVCDGDGGEVTSSVTFTPTAGSGTETVTFALDSTALSGHSLVAFEFLYSQPEDGDAEGTLLASHEDLTDEKQTVQITEEEEAAEAAEEIGEESDGTRVQEKAESNEEENLRSQTTAGAKTGLGNRRMFWVLLGCLTLILAVSLGISSQRRKKRESSDP